jgi:hypothetical protein
MRLLTGIVLLPLHNPVEIAEQGATIDVMSGGRFVLGVGVGYREGKYRTYSAWGQDRVVPEAAGFRLDFDELADERFLIGDPDDCIAGLRGDGRDDRRPARPVAGHAERRRAARDRAGRRAGAAGGGQPVSEPRRRPAADAMEYCRQDC